MTGSGPAAIGNDYRGADAVVLGASGFIGRWVARALASRGAIVHPVVRHRAAAEKILDAYGVTGRPVTADLSDPAAVHAMLGNDIAEQHYDHQARRVNHGSSKIVTAY